MTKDTKTRLPACLAFIVQLKPDTTTGGEYRFEGRIEHIATGETKHVVSAKELCEVFESYLLAHSDKLPDDKH